MMLFMVISDADGTETHIHGDPFAIAWWLLRMSVFAIRVGVAAAVRGMVVCSLHWPLPASARITMMVKQWNRLCFPG